MLIIITIIIGAWMNHFRAQSRNESPDHENIIPIIINNNNFNKGSDTEPTLLSYDDAITLFHVIIIIIIIIIIITIIIQNNNN